MDDIETLQKELEETKMAYEMTAKISQFKSSFLVKTAHELRSPLSSLMALHQLILADLCENPEEEREFIKQGFESAKKLLEILDRIVIISKIDYGKLSLKIETVSLNKIIDKVYILTEFQAKNYSLKIKLQQPETEIFIQADEERFIQGLTALIDTAITLMNIGTITISTKVNELESIAQILINVPCSIKQWETEQQELETSNLSLTSLQEWNHNLCLSPAMTFILCQTLLEKMGGTLNILDISPQNETETLTKLQCLMPLTSP
ncbi:MAG: HAMP domain-containing sensor histidine kinase [Crocosphaera sp.]